MDSDRTRNTIGREVTIGGCGLHTGEPCTLRLAPAGAGEGLVFYRDDLAPGLPIPATTAFVVATRNRIALGREGATVETVEHLLAVLAMAGISDCALHLTGPEVPAGDGSALPLWRLVEAAGVRALAGTVPVRTLPAPFWVEEPDRFLIALPAPRLRVTVTIDFPHPAIGCQTLSLEPHRDNFAVALAPARTFGFLADREHLHAAGLGLGGTEATALLFDDTGPAGSVLRFPDECVRHKMLDLLGGLALLGAPLAAHVVAWKSGHALDLRLVAGLLRAEREGYPAAGPDADHALAALCRRAGL